MSDQGWRDEFNTRIRVAAKTRRESRGWTKREVADRTEAFGHAISADTLTNIEHGRKKSLDAPELITLAHALELSPLELIYPGLIDEPVEATPGVVVSSSDAALAFTGYLDGSPMRTMYRLHDARQDYKDHGDSPNYDTRANAKQNLRGLEQQAKAQGWTVNDGEA